VKLTGERPIEGATPDSLLALHEAGYREVAARLGSGRVLDVGSGLGDATATLAGAARTVIGLDYDATTAIAADHVHGRPGELRFAAMDGARIGVRDRAVEAVCSSHVIEHFVQPERHVAEVARVLTTDGVAFFLTPNAPADFENPFHVYLFDRPMLTSLLHLYFDDVEVLGLEGDDVLQADFAARRASGERLLRLDVLRLRQRLPRRTYVWAYRHLLPVVYQALASDKSGVGSGIDHTHLFATPVITPKTPVLFAIARRPRDRVR
jgi:ubiquinone/menaquinone biosynthesis C-methylase UbiE